LIPNFSPHFIFSASICQYSGYLLLLNETVCNFIYIARYDNRKSGYFEEHQRFGLQMHYRFFFIL